MLLKDNNGVMDVSQLADESEQNVDNLLPLIESCKILGLATVKNGQIHLTKDGNELNIKNFSQVLSKKLASVEPFKSSIAIVGRSVRGLTTEALASNLLKSGIMIHGDSKMNEALLKSMLLKWAVRTNMLTYTEEDDTWKIV